MAATKTAKGGSIRFDMMPQEGGQKAAAFAMAPHQTIPINGYGGPKYGGKSWLIDFIAGVQALSHPINVIIIHKEYDKLKELHITPLKRYYKDYIEQGIMSFNATDKCFYIPKIGSKIKFQQVRRYSDAQGLNGQAWDIVLIDEAQFLSHQTLKFLPSICRLSHTQSEHRNRLLMQYREAKKEGNDKLAEQISQYYTETIYIPKMLYCFNWGGPGHSYLEAKFWDGCSHPEDPVQRLEKYETDEEGNYLEDPDSFRFIFGHWKDNKKGIENDPSYMKRISMMEEPYRTAYIKGDPKAFSGLCFDIAPSVHLVDGDELFAPYGGFIPNDWRLVGALDPGTADYCSFALYAISPEGKRYQLTDYYQNNRSAEDQIDSVYENIMLCRWTDGRLPSYIVAGKDAFAKRSRREIQAHDLTWQGIFRDKYRIRLIPARTERILGAQALRSALDYKHEMVDGKPKLIKEPKLYFCTYKQKLSNIDGEDNYKVVSICQPTIDEIGALEPSEKNPEDIKQEGVADHAYDRTRYFLMNTLPPRATEEKQKKEKERNLGYNSKKETVSTGGIDNFAGIESIDG